MKSEIKKKKKKKKKKDSNLTENKLKQYAKTIIVGGNDLYNQLGEKLNNLVNGCLKVISPSLNSSLNSSSLLSYSVITKRSVLVMRGYSLFGIDNNSQGLIVSSFTKTGITHFTEFSIKDHSDLHLTPISAVCSEKVTHYMFSKSSGRGRQLVYCDKDIKGGDPVFLDIGDVEPVSLFGGFSHASAISDKGVHLMILQKILFF